MSPSAPPTVPADQAADQSPSFTPAASRDDGIPSMCNDKTNVGGHANCGCSDLVNIELTSTGMTSTSATKTPIKAPMITKLAFFALCASVFLVALDGVLVPTALPSITRSLHVDDRFLAWIGSSYLLANAVSIPLWGKISDVFGRKPIVQLANVVFLAGSIVCAFSNNSAMLISGRAIQGLGGGGIIALVYICVSDLFDVYNRSTYMGILGGVWAVASSLGPVLSGIFSQKLNWRYCFYLNMPIIGVSMVVIYFTLKLKTTKVGLVEGLFSIDWPGTLSILVATLALLVGLQLGNNGTYTNPRVITMLVIALILYMIFPLTQVWASKRGRSGIMPLHIFKDTSNLSTLAVCSCDALVFNSVAYFLPVFFQLVFAKSPLSTGVYMLAIAIPLAVVSTASGYIIDKTGRFREVLQSGLFLMTLGVGLLNVLRLSSSHVGIIAILLVIGIGFGPNFGAPLIALQARTKEEDMAMGTATFGFVRMVSGAIGVIIGQVAFQRLLKPQYGGLLAAGLDAGLAGSLTNGEAISWAEAVARLPSGQYLAVRHTFMTALRGVWIFFTVVGALGLAVSFGITRTKLHHDSESGSADVTEASDTVTRDQ